MTNPVHDSNIVVVDGVLVKNGDDTSAATVPQSVIENTILLDKKLTIHAVDSLSYAYHRETFVRICKDNNFDETACDLLKQLIDLNSGYISPSLLRSHFGLSFAVCSRIAGGLISDNQAKLAPEGRQLYLLPTDKRKGGWLESSKGQDTIKA